MSRSNWAVYVFVREGIEAVCRLDRVREEFDQLRLHGARIVAWLSRQLEVFLLPTLHDNHVANTPVLHRYKVILSLVSMKNPILTVDDRNLLCNLRWRIETILVPHAISLEGDHPDHAHPGRPRPQPSPSPVPNTPPTPGPALLPDEKVPVEPNSQHYDSDYSDDESQLDDYLEKEAMGELIDQIETYEKVEALGAEEGFDEPNTDAAEKDAFGHGRCPDGDDVRMADAE
jgi:hypothetical protein